MEIMMKKNHLGLITALLCGVYQNAMALNITFDYRYDNDGFFDAVERRTVLEKAGEFWGSRISDNLTAAVSDNPGVRSYDVDIRHPSTGELDYVDDNLRNFSVQKNEYKIFVGTRDLNPSNPNRPTLGQAGFGGFGNIFGDDNYINNVRTRGQIGVQEDPPTDFQRWGGWISFDNRNTEEWYFDLDTSTFDGQDQQNAANKFDFFSTALHEIGHVLGIGAADTWNNSIVDIPGLGPLFLGPNANEVADGNIFIDQDDNGNLTGHFASETSGFGGGLFEGQEALMTPAAVNGPGSRKLPTNLDYAALKDVGWEVSASPVPVPTAIWFFGSGLLGLFGIKKRRVE